MRKDVQVAELQQYHDLEAMSNWEHDETEDPERGLRALRGGTRQLLINLFEMQSAAPRLRVRRIKRLANGRRMKQL